MNALGKFLESKAGTWCVLIVGSLLALFPIFGQQAGIIGAVALGYIGLAVPQLTLYRQSQIAKHLAGEPEDD